MYISANGFAYIQNLPTATVTTKDYEMSSAPRESAQVSLKLANNSASY